MSFLVIKIYYSELEYKDIILLLKQLKNEEFLFLNTTVYDFEKLKIIREFQESLCDNKISDVIPASQEVRIVNKYKLTINDNKLIYIVYPINMVNEIIQICNDVDKKIIDKKIKKVETQILETCNIEIFTKLNYKGNIDIIKSNILIKKFVLSHYYNLTDNDSSDILIFIYSLLCNIYNNKYDFLTFKKYIISYGEYLIKYLELNKIDLDNLKKLYDNKYGLVFKNLNQVILKDDNNKVIKNDLKFTLDKII
jgi:hypothetical protein